MAADAQAPVSPSEAAALFHDLQNLPAVLLAVSGGPDSTALMLLAACWRPKLLRGPTLIAATVDHGLRPEAAEEARAVAALARRLGITHRTLRWTGKKPSTGLQEAARLARYRLLAEAAKRVGAPVIVTAHTLEDQAETVLIRLMRGSGIAGLAGMRRVAPLPAERRSVIQPTVVRPFLSVPKSRLLATLAAANIAFADDTSNRDPRFTRARLRGLMPKLANEGLDARRLALLAARLARAEAALSQSAEAAYAGLAKRNNLCVDFPTAELMALAEETALRLLGRAIAETGDEGPIELGKLEALHSGLTAAYWSNEHFRRSLAGAVVTLRGGYLTVERAPPRRRRSLTEPAAHGRKLRKRK